MDKQKQVLLKMENLEDDYRRKNKQLNETMEVVGQEKWMFNRELEELSEQMRYIFQSREYNDTQGLQQVYHLIRSTQEEGEWTVKNVLKKLEDEQEEQQSAYKKQVLSYEETLYQLKKESDA
ncbi:hypothetical protein JZO66_06380 [Enterococcus sp. DIV0242_7C1]|uniref:Uncharacterized protein n=1 Tax=Candidatus Enterococcus dunnyi TaxID=1834192 RepID=A0A200J1V3_9ENTE|nr:MULTISPECIES: hypothetical protein [unclassified Enterococcus]MBO0470164.1 hypothetical protein [Enterococcus sp. DIV0242_7C1]OUZ30620.1 hypothetical protein A5889_002908 [Enterococcus sp. 9D6_DIV0238]